MKTLAFGALIRDDIIVIYSNRRMPLTRIGHRSIQERERPLHGSAIGNRPLNPAFIDCVIWTFGLAGAAIDAFFCYFDRHFYENLKNNRTYLCKPLQQI